MATGKLPYSSAEAVRVMSAALFAINMRFGCEFLTGNKLAHRIQGVRNKFALLRWYIVPPATLKDHLADCFGWLTGQKLWVGWDVAGHSYSRTIMLRRREVAELYGKMVN